MEINVTNSIQMELDIIKRSQKNIESLLDKETHTPQDLYIPKKLFLKSREWAYGYLIDLNRKVNYKSLKEVVKYGSIKMI
jgi:hypothetical protein